jgi:hypothetical protein
MAFRVADAAAAVGDASSSSFATAAAQAAVLGRDAPRPAAAADSRAKDRLDGAELLVHAVHDMLARVNLPVTLEQRTLMQQSLQLQQDKLTMRAELDQSLKEIQKKQQRLDAVDKAFECPVCMDVRVDAVLPCGHFFCHDCIGTLAARKCPQCRQAFASDKVVKVVLPF